MPKPLVILTDPLFPDLVRSELAPHARVRIARSPAELRRLLPQAEGLMTLLTDRVDAELLARAPRLRAIANVAVGINNLDLDACRARGIRVVNTPGVLVRATAELTLALLLAAARRLPEGEAVCRKDAFPGWSLQYLLGLELHGRRALIVGQGQIGRETGRLFRALGLRVSFVTRRDSSAQIRTKLRQAQVLSFHCPLTAQTRHWLDARRLALLPRDAIVLNTARGPVVDEAALARALRTRQIFAAGLDVYEREPRIHPALLKLPNAVLAPHIGSATRETRRAMTTLAITGLRRLLNGQAPRNEVRS